MKQILLVLFALMFCVGPVSAFEDSVQRYTYGISDLWLLTDNHSSGSISVYQYPSTYSTSNCIRFESSGSTTSGMLYIETLEDISPSYFAFKVRGGSVLNHPDNAYDTYLRYYASSNNSLILSVNLPELFGISSSATQTPDIAFYEFIKSGDNVVVYKDGVEYGSVGSLAGFSGTVHMRFDYGSSANVLSLIIDDISTSSILGMNQDWTQANTYIDTSYGIQSMESFPSADYSVQTSRITTGAVINTTQLGSGASGDPAGFVRWNRNDIFGDNFGLYQSRILRDGNVLASTKFSILDSTVAGSVSWIDDSYATGAAAGINYDLVSPDFSSYYYYLNIINSGGTGFSQNLITISDTELVTLTGYPIGDCYAVLSRTSISTGVSSDIAYGLMTITASGAAPKDTISIPYSEYERGDTVDVTFSHEVSGYIVVYGTSSGVNYHISNGFVGSGSNMTYSFEIDDLEPFDFYYVVLKSSAGMWKDATGYTLVETTSPYNNSISLDASEYYYDGIVNVTYSHSQSGSIKVQHVQSNEIYHISNSFDGDGDNETWLFNIAGTDPLGLYNVLLLNDEGWVKGTANFTVTPAAMASTWLNVIEESVILYEDVNIAYKAVNSSTLIITDPNGYEVYNQTVQSSVIRYVSHTVINGTGVYDVELDGDTVETDSFFVYLVEEPVIEIPVDDSIDVLGDDETMTEYYNEKFRDFAPTIWGFFMLMCLLFLMSIFTSFNSGGKR